MFLAQMWYHFPFHYSVEKMEFFIKNPQAKNNFTAYLEPFTVLSWLCTIIFLILMPLCLYTVNQIGTKNISLNQAYASTAEALLYRQGTLEYSGGQSNKLATFR